MIGRSFASARAGKKDLLSSVLGNELTNVSEHIRGHEIALPGNSIWVLYRQDYESEL